MSRELVLVVARADNGVIGRAGKLPWHIPEDLKHFRKVTGTSPMVMGRRTFESLPGLLPGRRHIVLTRDGDWSAPGAEVARDVEAALALAGEGRVCVIGGAEVFRLFEPLATRIELTEVHDSPAGDTLLLPFEGWREVARRDAGLLSFVTLER